MTPKKYDIVIYGATGFTGRQAVNYCIQHVPKGITWAIAGRNQEKLRDIRGACGGDASDIDILVADCQNEQAIDSMVRQTRIIVSTAGPFALYGENLIAGCCRYGTDYVDITGETYFIRQMIDKYEDQAKATGAKIIPSCGFDAVPSDTGVLIATQYIKKKLRTTTGSTNGFFSIKGGFNGGTLFTMLNLFESGAWPKMKDPEILLPLQSKGLSLRRDESRVGYNRDIHRWTAPFMMGPINTAIVNRSAALFAGWGEGYGNNFLYREYQKIGKWWNPLPALLISLALQITERLGQLALYRKFMRLVGPRTGEGPSARSIKEGFFRLEVIAFAENKTKVRVLFSGAGDPGNKVTVKFLCEAAFCLACQRNDLPGGDDRCGFLTPATGLGTVLIERLKDAGIKINCEAI